MTNSHLTRIVRWHFAALQLVLRGYHSGCTHTRGLERQHAWNGVYARAEGVLASGYSVFLKKSREAVAYFQQKHKGPEEI